MSICIEMKTVRIIEKEKLRGRMGNVLFVIYPTLIVVQNKTSDLSGLFRLKIESDCSLNNCPNFQFAVEVIKFMILPLTFLYYGENLIQQFAYICDNALTIILCH